MKKKAALELSINAIVLLILAITMLGLGLTFMKNSFKDVTKSFDIASDQLRKSMIEKLEDSKKDLIFSKDEIELKRGESETIYMGIKNTLNHDAIFDICNHRETVGLVCSITVCLSIADGETTCDSNILLDTFSQVEIKSGESKILPINIKVLGTTVIDTYEIPIQVTEDDWGTDWIRTESLFVYVKS